MPLGGRACVRFFVELCPHVCGQFPEAADIANDYHSRLCITRDGRFSRSPDGGRPGVLLELASQFLNVCGRGGTATEQPRAIMAGVFARGSGTSANNERYGNNWDDDVEMHREPFRLAGKKRLGSEKVAPVVSRD